MSLREVKGQDIATRFMIAEQNGLYLVPSQSGKGKYEVNAEVSKCSCPDFEIPRAKCKHMFAVEFTIRREKKTTVKTDTKGNTTTTTTETVKVEKKITYRQEWPAYNKAQTMEKAQFQYLLRQLCEGIGEPAQTNGRPRLPLEDMIFAMAFKVYSTFSGRRFMSDLRDANGKGYLSKLPCYNSIFHYFENEMLTPYLQMLIEESALPLASIERDFAVDSTGISTNRFVQWMHAKYSDPHLIEKRTWVKVHLMCGVTTNVVTAVEITDRFAGDSPQFEGLVDTTAQNFNMREVSADKAYLSKDNMRAVVRYQAMPFIAFKSNSKAENGKSYIWKHMYHYYSYNQERFMQNYHKRSNVETTFHMIKSKFGDALRSKTERAQINEALCKVLCHNICCLIQSMYELNLRPKFWAAVA
jgi:transposase